MQAKLYIPSTINTQINLDLLLFCGCTEISSNYIMVQYLTFEGFFHILMSKTNTYKRFGTLHS